MIPVKLNLHTSRDRVEQFSYEVISDEFLTRLLLNLTVFNSIAARERSVGEATVSVDGSITMEGQDPIKLQRRFSAANAAVMAAGAIAAPVGALMSSGFDNVNIRGIGLDITSIEGKSSATLGSVSLESNDGFR